MSRSSVATRSLTALILAACLAAGLACHRDVAALVLKGPGTTQAGQPIDVSVVAVDKDGSAVDSYQATLAISSSDPSALLPANLAVSRGSAAFKATLSAPGVQSISAIDAARQSITGVLKPIAVQSPGAGSFRLQGSASVGLGLPYQVTIVPLDPTGHALAAYPGTVHLTSSDVKARLRPDGPWVSPVQLVFGTPGPQTLVVHDLAAPGVSGALGVAVLTPTPPAPPPLDRSVTTTVAVAASFLFQGPTAQQAGVAAGAIDDARASVVRGRVRTQGGLGLAGVSVTALGHSEWGATATGADGSFAFVLNGGQRIALSFSAAGFPTAHRTFLIGPNREATLGEVALVGGADQAILIQAGSPQLQVVRAAVSKDAQAGRQPTLLFPLTLLAGTGELGFAGDGGPAKTALLTNPSGLAVARDGTIYISDRGNGRIRSVDPLGIIRTVAGVGPGGSWTDGIPARVAWFPSPGELAFGPDGSLFVLDAGVLRRID